MAQDIVLRCPVCKEPMRKGARGCAMLVGAEEWVRTARGEEVRRMPRLWFCCPECKERYERARAGEPAAPLFGDLLEDGFALIHEADAAEESGAAGGAGAAGELEELDVALPAD